MKRDCSIPLLLSPLVVVTITCLVLPQGMSFSPLIPRNTKYQINFPLQKTALLSSSSTPSSSSSSISEPHELEQEYRQMEQALVARLVEQDEQERYQLFLQVKKDEEKVEQAQEHVHQAEETLRQAHQQALEVNERAHVVETIDQVFDNDLEAVQAAQQAESLAIEDWTEACFEEMAAELEYDQAQTLLEELQRHQALLRDELERRRNRKKDAENDYNVDYDDDDDMDWERHHWPQHQSFLRNARHILQQSGRLIDHDPSKGNVAF